MILSLTFMCSLSFSPDMGKKISKRKSFERFETSDTFSHANLSD